MSKSKDTVVCAISEKDFLTPVETMAYLDITESTLKKWRDSGLPVIKIGGRRFYAKEQIKEFMLQFAE